MKANEGKRLPKILKVNRIDAKNLKVFVLFSTGENRTLDFKKILKQDWHVSKGDLEYKLFNPKEFSKVKVNNHTLSWSNLEFEFLGLDKKTVKVPFEVGADVLYVLSTPDARNVFSIGALFKKARKASKKSQQEVAELAGTSRTYITRLENDKQDIELLTLKKLVEAGLNKKLKISID
ncbi:MAG: helix-turn-helix transcriptional regulator [Bacteroidetes bacterium]|nr:helix-turn-helix transcriptional regulator [Bacteroidota bacterium]